MMRLKVLVRIARFYHVITNCLVIDASGKESSLPEANTPPCLTDQRILILRKAFRTTFLHAIPHRVPLATMSEDRLDLLRQAVRNMLAALQMPDVDNTELYDLTLHIGHTGKLCNPPSLGMEVSLLETRQ